jgi:pimeloyl-ACP methyl ester carboxylesterase
MVDLDSVTTVRGAHGQAMGDCMMAFGISETSTAANGVSLHVASAGDPANPPILLVHGLYDRWETWTPVIEALSDRYYIIAPDLRGHARSSQPETGYALADYAADLASLIESFDVGPAVVAGHSLGALIGIRLAVVYPEQVSSLILIDPPFESNAQTRDWVQILLDARRGEPEETYATVKELNILTGDEDEWRRQTEWLRSTAPGPFEAMIEMIDSGTVSEIFDTLAEVTCRTLLLQADPRSGGALTDDGAERAIAALSHGDLQKFHYTGHSIHLERTGEFVQSLNAFLYPTD